MKIAFTIAMAAIVFSSCSTTNHVYLSVQEPAPVTIQQNIKTVVVINRTGVAKRNRALDVIDKVMTLEGAKLDEAGAEASVTGLADELSANNRFTAVRLQAAPVTGNASPGFFPVPLSWNEVEKICDENNATAVFALELFDTDSKIDYTVNQVTLKTPLGTVPGIEHQANMQTLVKTGWRIYDPAMRSIADEYSFSKSLNYSARGINPMVAAAGLINRREAVKETGSKSGHAYAQRIIPYWIRVYRDYYIKGSENFTIATRMARTGNWKGAEERWSKETASPDGKIAGRACYNMAIINEINGDIDKAIEWAKRAYENYNNHPALEYVNILKNRKINDTLLQDQAKH